MGFDSGAVTFRRFFVAGSMPTEINDRLISAIGDNAFGQYGEASSDGVECGWITNRHLFDTRLTVEQVAVGRFLYLAMRVDRTKVPAAIIKSYVQIEEAAALEASGKPFLSKEERRQARESAHARADREIRAGIHRRVASYPVLIDPADGVVYFANLGETAQDKLHKLFKDTFDVALSPGHAGEMAFRVMNQIGASREYDEAKPIHLVPVPPEFDEASWTSDIAERRFFGREFLSWLWYRIDSGNPTIKTPDGLEVAVAIDRVIDMRCDFKLTGSDIIRGDNPASSPEAQAALAVGKQPHRLGMLWGSRSDDYAFSLIGPDLSISSLTLPASEAKDEAGRIEERFEQIREFCKVLDQVFAVFCRLRSSSKWSTEHAAMRAWVRQTQAETNQPVLASA